MIDFQRIQLAGRRFVLIDETSYERLCRDAGVAAPVDDLPDLPKPDRRGNFPAVEYARISLARDLIRSRKASGLSQQQLAALAGVRQETLSRLESGKHTATPRTIERITKAIDTQRRKRRTKANSH